MAPGSPHRSLGSARVPTDARSPQALPAASGTNDTWNAVAAAPSALTARSQPAIASDPALGGIVLFGGYDPISTLALSDTWLFSNGSWSDLGAYFTTAPTARWGASLAFDAADGYLVLFGGRDGSTTFSDTWVLSAGDARSAAGWSKLTLTTAPSARSFAPTFYDPTSSSVIVFGGGCAACASGGAWIANNQTWSFSSGKWTNETSTVGRSPGRLMTGYAAWDPALGGAVYFGGQDGANNCTGSNATWLFHGKWTKLVTNGTPTLLVNGGMAWDAPEDELVLYAGLQQTSGACAPDSNTTWTFHNYNWTDVTSPSDASTLIGAICCVGVASDPFGQVVVTFGGDNQNQTYFNLTWSYPALPFVVNAVAGTRGIANQTSIAFSTDVTGGVSPYSFNWSFGDGTLNSTTANTSHVYASTGTYVAVSLVTDAAGRLTRTVFSVTVDNALSLNATASPRTGDAPFPVRFNATGTGGFRPYNWTWAFGDGFWWNGPNVTHTYSIGGTFNVTLWLNDSINEHRIQHFVVVVYGRLVAAINASATSVLAPTEVNFSAILKGGTSPFLYFWTFAPNATGTGQETSYDFTTPGTYNVSLVVTDGLGYSSPAILTVHVYAHLSVSAEVSNPIGIAPVSESFTALPVGGAPPLYYSWNFGDQSPTVPGLTTIHQYLEAGNYTVLLTVTDALGESVNTSLSVEIVRPLFVVASLNVTQGRGPLAVAMTASTTGGIAPLSFLWSFGDGSGAIGQVQTHTYLVGSYVAKVTVTDDAGENVSGSSHLTVYLALTVSVTADPATLVLGNVTTLAATVNGGVAPTTLSWSGLPPGCFSRNTANIDCLATTSGSFPVIVDAVDSANENVSATVTLRVNPVNASGCCAAPASTLALSNLEIAGIAGGLAVVALAVVAVVLLRRGRRPPAAPSDGDVDGESTPAAPGPTE